MTKLNRPWHAVLGALVLSVATPLACAATTLADADPFYAYDGSKGPIGSVAPGTVIKQRTATYYFNGSPTPYTLVQLLYRTNNAQMQPVVNVTSIIKGAFPNGRAVVDEPAYDSTNPFDSPSVKLHNDIDITLNPGIFGGGLSGIISTLGQIKYVEPFKRLADQGYSVIVPDSEGETADFALGAEEGMTTLDAIRAALSAPDTGLAPDSKVAMLGYSGGAIAVDWAAQLAPSYAPDVNARLVGAAYGGLLISPINNIVYINKQAESGIAPLALTGMARGYGIDQTPYLNNAGEAVFAHVSSDSIGDAAKTYPFRDVFNWLLPQYQQIVDAYLKDHSTSLSGLPAIQAMVNNTDAGLQAAPTIPVFFVQGSVGITLANFSSDPGDGIMLARDARSLVQQFCKTNSRVQYEEPLANHLVAALLYWKPAALQWIDDRFAAKPAPGNCTWTNSLRGSYIGRTN
jgi:triacylglycerol lipase